MFGLRRWAERRRSAIFRFYDGRRYRCLDPMVVIRRLEDHPKFDWQTHPQLIAVGQLDALEITAEAVRDAFGVKPVDDNGSGFTEEECVELLGRFAEYLAALKKNGSPSPISPPFTASESSAAESPTNVASDSGSTAPDNTFDDLTK